MNQSDRPVEHPVGSFIIDGNRTFKVVESSSCDFCEFEFMMGECNSRKFGRCSPISRCDGKSVIFILYDEDDSLDQQLEE